MTTILRCPVTFINNSKEVRLLICLCKTLDNPIERVKIRLIRMAGVVSPGIVPL